MRRRLGQAEKCGLYDASIIRFHIKLDPLFTSHKVHSSYFILSFEERLHGRYHTSNDSTGRKSERVNASVLRLLSETNWNWRSTLIDRYAENLAHYALERNQVYTNADPRVFHPNPVN